LTDRNRGLAEQAPPKVLAEDTAAPLAMTPMMKLRRVSDIRITCA
jgi:hypothetical protein